MYNYISLLYFFGLSLALVCIAQAKWSLADLMLKPTPPPVENPLCDIEDSDACGEGFCCVKEVLIHKGNTESYRVTVGRSCKPLRSDGDLCMVNNEGYLCPCKKGLRCQAERHFHFGHCTE
ncbi:hypothetical protein ScPMuIL_013055 [Solemya velum]